MFNIYKKNISKRIINIKKIKKVIFNEISKQKLIYQHQSPYSIQIFKCDYNFTKSLNLNIYYFFNRTKNHIHSHQDPIKQFQKQINIKYIQLESAFPNNPHKIIEQLYKKCQKLITQNKKAQVFIVFDKISSIIMSSQNLIQKYSSFLIHSANNNFLIAKYQDVIKKCLLALPYQIKKHNGQENKIVAGIYNILGISTSKISTKKQKNQQALKYLEKALKIRKQLNSISQQVGQVLYNMGIIYEQILNQLQNAQQRYVLAIQAFENSSLSNKLLYIRIKLRLAQVQFKIHYNLQKSIGDLSQIQQLINKNKLQNKFIQRQLSQLPIIISIINKSLGQRFNSIGNYIKAITYYEKCLNYLKQSNMQGQDRIKTLQLIAACYVKQNKFQKALLYLQQSYQIIKKSQKQQIISKEYIFNFLKYLTYVYRNVSLFQKQKQCYKDLKKKLTQFDEEKFINFEKVIQIEFGYIYCLKNNEDYHQVIEEGQNLLKLIQKKKKQISNQLYFDYKSNSLWFIGQAYNSLSNFAKENKNISLTYFQQSIKMYENIQLNSKRLNIFFTLIKKTSQLRFQLDKFPQAIQQLNKIIRKIMDCNKQVLNKQKKLYQLVNLLADSDFQIQHLNRKNNKITTKYLCESGYINYLSKILSNIVNCMQSLSSKNYLQSYLSLANGIKIMIQQFLKLQDFSLKQFMNMIDSLQRIYDLYSLVFKQQIQLLELNKIENEDKKKQIKNFIEIKIFLNVIRKKK